MQSIYIAALVHVLQIEMTQFKQRGVQTRKLKIQISETLTGAKSIYFNMFFIEH